MKNLQIALFLCFVSLSFIACDSLEQVVTFDVPKTTSKLVIHSIMNSNDQTLTVFVGSSTGATEIGVAAPVKDAKVELYKGSQLLHTLTYDHLDSSKWGSSNNIAVYQIKKVTPITASGDYTLKVSAPNFKPVEATQILPNVVKIESAIFKTDGFTLVGFGGGQELLDELKVSFQDPAGENYYMLAAIDTTLVDTTNNGGGLFTSQVNSVYLTPQEEDKAIENTNDFFSGELFFNDQLFDAKPRSIRLGLNKTSFGTIPSNLRVGLEVWLMSINKDTYFYQKSLNAYSGADGNPFAEPTVVNSNVKDGFGFFMMRNISRAVVKL
jgi:hypothetical protein